MKPLISVIVPVYNVAPYLDRCVESIVGQTYTQLEIILVDDGSTDGSGALCDGWAARDARISVVHKENGGASDARNAGVARAQGDYIGLVDSDDVLHPAMYASLYDILQRGDAQIAECRLVPFGDGDALPAWDGTEPVGQPFEVLSAQQALQELICWRKCRQTPTNKLYEAAYVRQIPFAVGKINEDEFWTYRVFALARRVAYTDAVLYYYYQRENSIMHVPYSAKRLDGLEAFGERMHFVREHFPALDADATAAYLSACMYHYQAICRNSDIDADGALREMLIGRYRAVEAPYRRAALRTFSKARHRLWLRAFRICPGGVCRIRNALKIGL